MIIDLGTGADGALHITSNTTIPSGTYNYTSVLIDAGVDLIVLKPATIKQKKTGNSPLLETGELKDSYNKSVQDKTASVGSNNEKAGWMEYGVPSNNIPARPVASPESRQADKYFPEIVDEELLLKIKQL